MRTGFTFVLVFIVYAGCDFLACEEAFGVGSFWGGKGGQLFILFLKKVGDGLRG